MNLNTLNLTILAQNTSLTSDSGRDQTLAYFEIAILSVIFLLIVFGNGAVILALIASRIKIERMYYFLLHLSISDLLTAFFNVFPQLIWEITVRFYGGNILCKFVKYIQLLGPYLSSYILVVTAIDRYRAICFPLTNCSWTERKAKVMIFFAWCIALICCLPQAFIFSYVRIPSSNDFKQDSKGNPQINDYLAFDTKKANLFENKSLEKQINADNLKSYYKKDTFFDEQKSNNEIYFECWGIFIQPWGEKVYVLWYAISVFFIPLLVLSFTYFNICKEIWINAKNTRYEQNQLKLCKKSTLSMYSAKCATTSTKITFNKSNQIKNLTQNLLKKPSIKEINIHHLKHISENGVNNLDQNCNLDQNSFSSLKVEDGSLTSNLDLNEAAKPNSNSILLQKPISNGQDSNLNTLHFKHVYRNQFEDENKQIKNHSNRKWLSTSPSKQSPKQHLNTCTPRNHSNPTKLSKAKIKTIKITLVVIICYISCSLPFVLVQIWAQWWPGAQNSDLWTGPLITITMLLPSLNSCVNPWIYLSLNHNLWKNLLRLLFGYKCAEHNKKAQKSSLNLYRQCNNEASASAISVPLIETHTQISQIHNLNKTIHL